MLIKKLRFFVAAPPPSGAEHIEGAVHFEVLHGTASTEVTPAPEGLGAGATNPMQPKTSNSKSGKYSLHSKYCRPQFKFKTFRPSSFAPVGQTKTLRSKLAINLQRPLGFVSYRRLSHRLRKSPLSDKASSRHYPHSGRKQFNRERSSRFIDKTGHPPSSSGAGTRWVCQQPISCPQKRGWSETSHKFKALKSIREVRALQNGEYSHATRSTKKRPLSGQNRFEGCLLHGPSVWVNHQKFLRFLWKETLYEFACLPFGLASAPRVFTKIMKPVVGLLRQLGIRIVIYLDDMLIMAQTREMANVMQQQL